MCLLYRIPKLPKRNWNDEDFDGLRDYLEEEGIYGYDDTIIDIYKTGEINIPDMDEEDYEKFFKILKG